MAEGHQLAMALRRAYLALHRGANAHFEKFGVTADQFVLLTLLAEEDGITQQELVGRSFSDPNTVRAMLVLLERQGLLSRQPHTTDGRARCVTLTKKGRRLQEKVRASAAEFHESWLTRFATSERKSLIEHLQRIELGITPTSRRRVGSQSIAS